MKVKSEIAQVRGARSGARSLTARDVEILRWLSRVRFATSEHVAERFTLHATKSRRRLAVLTRQGLISSVRLLHGQPAAHFATRAGLRLVGLAGMPVATVSLQSFTHDEQVTRQLIAFEAQGMETATEREMRLAERVLGEQHCVQIPPHAAANASTHRPDLLFRVVGTDRWNAAEVELSAKSEARLSAILTGYRASDYGVVVYCVPTANLVERVQRVATNVGLGTRLHVVTIDQRSATAA